MKLNNQLSFIVTAVSATTLLASFIFAYVFVDLAERRELDVALFIQAQSLIRSDTSLSLKPLRGGKMRVPEGLRASAYYIAIYSNDGTVLNATDNFVGKFPHFRSFRLTYPVPSEGEYFDLVSGNLALRAIALPYEHNALTLIYAVSSQSVDKDSDFLRRTLTFLFCLAVLSTWLFSRWLADRLARDVQAIAHVAREVAHGNFHSRVGGRARGSRETRALAADLDQMIEQLGKLVDSQRVFISHAAHELRSPLTTLRGELQLALRRPREVEEYEKTILMVLRDVESLTQLAEGLLSLARAQAATVQNGTAHIGDLVAEGVRNSKGLADLRGVQLKTEAIAPDVADRKVGGVTSDLARALRNLIDNAIAHSNVGGEVRVHVALVGAYVEVAVEDHGPGISTEDLSRIFEPFYRAPGEQEINRGGAGLGLAIARKILQNAGGDIHLDSTYASGARFVLSLPNSPSFGDGEFQLSTEPAI